ncbi:DNA cytosine methyltransferase [Paraburkholderia sediminicola]|jgi:DNA (cytosine-5)-methyltransferase 1|nr:DNA cytosine methyltransferase [Paraburkholderia sediminicola]
MRASPTGGEAIFQKTPMHASPYVAVDLFAGGGGLSLGLKQAGFAVCAAVEINVKAAETYAANHPEAIVFQRDITKVSGSELVAASPTGVIDLIAACPPCQGFSQLTAKYRRHDFRNELIFEFVRIVGEVRPKTIMMENVPGLVKKGKKLFDMAMADLGAFGYKLSSNVLEVADYGVPQRRSRLVVLGAIDVEVPIPPRSHSSRPKEGLRPWATVRNAIGHTSVPLTLRDSIDAGGPKYANWHVVRDLRSDNLARLAASVPGGSRSDLPIHLRPPCHRSSDTGFSNMYGRMEWDQPAPTITGGCTSLSKGRFGHPAQLRTISVREAAMLQTFPESYVIATPHVEDACKIIGNALPPLFAKIMAKSCVDILRGN